MSKQWLVKDKLCSFDEKVRVELGPQIIEMDCTEANLKDTVTAPHYKVGAIDAFGKVIDPGKEGKMHCVDWRGKQVPHVWKVYQHQFMEEETVELGVRTGNPDPEKIYRFIKVAEFEGKGDALAHAETVYGEMQ